MTILLIHNFYREAGGEDIVFAQERALLEQNGHKVITYTRSNDEAEELSPLRLFSTMVSAKDSRKDIEQIIRDYSPDLAHVHNTFMMISPSIYDALLEAKIPCVHTIHNFRMVCPAAYLFRDGKVCEECIIDGLFSSVRHNCRESLPNTAAVALMTRIHRMRGTWTTKVNAFICLTEFSRTKMISGGLPAHLIHVKPNFVGQDPGERTGTPGHALFVGRLSGEKGVSTLLKAWQLLNAEIPLKIAGDGNDRQKLEAEASELRLTNVEFLGRQDKSSIGKLMKEAAFLVLPSLWYEGFPMVLVESFACGVPVIGSRLGAMQEIIDDGVDGLHFTAGSPQDLADKVAWAWANPAEMQIMGHNARKKFQLKYGAEVNYASLMAIYGKAMSQTLSTTNPN